MGAREREGEAVIELRIRQIAQLFESLDPSPFHERDLDAAAAAYILDWARELPRDRPIVIRIHLVDAATARPEELAAAIRGYFAEEAEAVRRDLRELFAMGRLYLAIGVAALALAILGGNLARAVFAPPLSALMQEGLIILGWVANWKPLETFLYDWLPLRRRRRLFGRLARARIELVETA